MKSGQYCVLIVDDEPVVRRILERRLSSEGYRCEEASNAEEALRRMAETAADLVFLDVKMPGESGVELLPKMKSGYPDTAVIMATSTTDTATAIRCMRAGASDYIIKPFVMEEVSLSAERALERRTLELENKAYQQHLEEMVDRRTAELREAMQKIKMASLDTIHRLAQAAEYRDEGTGAHIKRIGQYCGAIARRMGLPDAEVENLQYAAPMHDVGKIGIPDRILLKPGKLDADEWEIMKRHTTIGAEIMRGSDTEFMKLAEIIALTHHEWWDGTGYPAGLKGPVIPLAGRITAVADLFDALTSARPYKEAFTVEKSLEIVTKSRGSHIDPQVADAFFAAEPEIISVIERYKDEDAGFLTGMALRARQEGPS